MTTEHLISLINANFNNIDDLKKIQNAVECLLEAATLEESLKEEERKTQPPTLKQMQARTITRTANINRTHLQGRISTTFNKLVECFGLPCENNPPSRFEKVTTQWKLRFPCGTIATIYNWKNYGFQPADNALYDWHIGGYTADAKALVMDELGMIP